MRPIPTKLKNDMAADGYYDRCCLCHYEGVQWHHNLIFGGRQVNEKFAILPLCPNCHHLANRKDVKELCDWIMLQRSTMEERARFTKAHNYEEKFIKLKEKYGDYDPKKTYFIP